MRQRILEAAVELFGTRGVAGTTTRAIAETAGVSTSLLLHHYISKDVLAADCEDYVVRTILEEKLGGHSMAEAAARLLGDPKLESRLRFITPPDHGRVPLGHAHVRPDGQRNQGRDRQGRGRDAVEGNARIRTPSRWS